MSDQSPFRGAASSLLDELKSALIFLTRLPPALIAADSAVRPDFRTAARVFPVAGALIGAAGGVVMSVAYGVGMPPWVGAALAVAGTALATGGLHEDGLADFADSFGAATRERKFAILDDSRVGTYGALALVMSIVLRVAALGALLSFSLVAAVAALVAGEAASRAALVRMWHDLPAARANSLSSDTGPPEYPAVLTALVIAAILVLAALPALGWRATLLASVLAIAAAYGAIRLAASSLGGRTGDTLGACQQAALVAFLVGASIA